MDPNQWNTYNIQYGHPPSGGLPSVHPSLNRLDLSPAGLSHQLQAGRGVPSLQAVNYQTLSGLPILDTLSPLTSGLSAQGHQLVFDPQTNRLSAEPQHPTPAQQLASPHSYENPGGGHSKSSNSRSTSESLNRNQLLEAARMWSTSATNFTSPTSLYNQFNAALFPQSVENPPASSSVSASSGQLSVSSVSKSSQNYSLHQQSPCLHDPPPAHSSNMSGTSRLLPVVQRPPEHSLQLGASDTLYNSSRSTPSATETVSQVTRPLFTTHKAVVLGVGNSGLAQLQQDLHRQTPGQQQHQQQNFYQAHRRGDIEDLSSGNTHSNIYGSYANLSTQSSNFISNTQHRHQHLSSGDISYEAVSPAPPLQQQQQHQRQQQESNMAAHHPSLSFNLGQFPELSSLTAEQAHAFSDKFQENEMRLQMDTRVQTAQNSNTLASTPLQRHQRSSGSSLKIPSQQQQHPKSSAEISGHPTGVTVTSQNMVRMQSAASFAPVSQQQPIAVSSSLLNTPSAPSPVQALADSTTKPKRSRARKKKGESTSLPVITSANASDTNPIVLSQMHPSPQSESIAPSSSRESNQGKKSNLPPSNFQSQEHLSQAGLNLTSPHQHISTLSMAHTSNSQQPSYARVQIPSASQSFSVHDQQTFRNNISFSKIPTSHNAPGIRQQVEFEKTPPTYKHQQKPISKTKVNVPGPGGQQLQQPQAYSQHAGNLSQTRGSALLDSQGRVLNYVVENQHKVDDQINSTHGVGATGPYSKLLGQDQMFVSDSGNCNHLQQPDHLLEEENSRVQQHYQMDFGSQPFMEQLAGVSATPSTSDYGGEVVLTNLVSHEETARLQQQQQSGSSLGVDNRPSYDDIRPLDHLSGQQINQLEMEEVQFNTMFSQNDQVTGHGSLQEELPPAPEPEMTLTFVPHVVEDDELGHFTNPELSEPVPMLPKQKQNQPRVLSLPSMSSCGTDSFQNSFLSYLQGHKQETLSSVSSSAVTKKPQLPKYIPEPKRPKPPPPPAAANKLATFKDSSQSFFNTDDSSKRGRDLISTFNDTPSQKSESGKEGYSVQRTSDLAVKITLPKSKSKSRFGPFAESTLLKDSMRKNRERKRKRGRGLGDDNDDVPVELSDDETQPAQRKKPVPKQVASTPTRASIGRKAKDKCIEMTKKHNNSDSDDSFGEEIKQFRSKSKGYKSDDSIYNSDDDPAWMPFALDLNQGELIEKRKRPRRQRLLAEAKLSKQGGARGRGGSHGSIDEGSKTAADVSSNTPIKVGTYMIEKKDMENSESYPIWRMEENNQIRKFDLKVVNENVKHLASETACTWMPSMANQFQPIKVRETEVREGGIVSTVEVLEEYRPKGQVNSKLEVQYEDDPLVDPFNVYLQVFLSQALEPNFLSVIKETNELFYLDALDQIDGMIEKKCKEITKLARWKLDFQEALHRCPLMKEIDRPNLKQACQASENASPPSIKSVFLSGVPYDRFLLTEKPGSGNHAKEFMIGKLAAQHVRTYHSLYHFKYWLRQRCDTKVKMTKESNKAENLTDEIVLDKCLENRNWVLQLFDNLKSLLRNGGDAPS